MAELTAFDMTGSLTRYARVVDGVVMEPTIEVPIDPNDWFVGLEGTWYLCSNPDVASWWLYDDATQTYSSPTPITDPPLTGTLPPAAGDLLVELKNNPELLAEFQKLLVK